MGTVIRYRITSVSFREQRGIAQLGICIIKIFTATLQTAWTSYTARPGLSRYLTAVESSFTSEVYLPGILYLYHCVIEDHVGDHLMKVNGVGVDDMAWAGRG